jgi:hypothetical protein
MPEAPPALAIGDRLVVSDDEDPLHVVTTRSDDHLFVTTYRETEGGPVRLALQVDITTGATAIDPRSFDRAFWTLVVRGTPQPQARLREALAAVTDPSIEVMPARRELRIEDGAP